MKRAILIFVFLSATQAHYVFPSLVHHGVTTPAWAYVCQTANYESHSPMKDVSAVQLRCHELTGPPYSTGTLKVEAGETIGFQVSPNIQHPGPVAFYMAKVPEGQTPKTFQGEGDVWFKIFYDQPSFGASQLAWPSEGVAELSVQIPRCIAAGDYLLRVEHIGLHGAYDLGAAQFFQACAQLSVGGSGTEEFPGVSLPGNYSETDPGIHVDIWWPVPTNYTNPGPLPVECLSTSKALYI